LGALSTAARDEILSEATLFEVPRGQPILADAAGEQRLAMMLDGAARTYITMPNASQVTVRYARAGSMLATATSAGPGSVRILLRALTPCTLIELPLATLRRLVAADPTVAVATAAEVTARLEDVYRAFVATVSGTLRERMAVFLLAATEVASDGRLVALITQHDLADALGSAREVVGRSLRELNRAGIVKTGRGGIELTDTAALVELAGRWWQPGPLLAFDPLLGSGGFDNAPDPVLAVDRSGAIVYCNDRLAGLFGWPAQALRGQPLTALVPGRHHTAHRANLRSFMARPRTGPMGHGRRDLNGRRQDGSLFPVEITLLPASAVAGPMVFAKVVDISYRQALRDYFAARAAEQGQGARAAEPALDDGANSRWLGARRYRSGR